MIISFLSRSTQLVLLITILYFNIKQIITNLNKGNKKI